MKTIHIPVSANFKKAAAKSFFALLFFAVSYSAIMVISLALATVCIVAGIKVAIAVLNYFTIILGAAIIGMGVLIAYYLLKFLFKFPKKQDLSNLIEITPSTEPKLFNLIHDVADQVGTKHPLKVYISGDVNASVFYNSSFWSMFFPVRKNLIIGLGLVNSTSTEELKGILAHEFGHFSQRSMIFGSYVHNVNKILHNLLFDNDDFNEKSSALAGVNYLSWIFVQIAVYIVRAIHWICKQIYTILNTSYLELSRQMEFHADHIAASVVGIEPMQNSLLRMSLSDFTYTQVLEFYDEKIAENIKSENLYADHHAALHFTAKHNQLKVSNGLPVVTLIDLKRYNKTKLNIKDAWASHPSNEDRLASLHQTGLYRQNDNFVLANTLFSDIEKTQKQMTQQIYKTVTFNDVAIIYTTGEFDQLYQEKIVSTANDKQFNGYFDNKFPLTISVPIPLQAENLPFEKMFDQQKVDWVYEAIALKNDIEAISNIKNQKIKTFEYDGKTYSVVRASELIKKLQPELNALEEKIFQNDYSIYQYFYRLAETEEQKIHFKKKYLKLNDHENKLTELNKIYATLNVALAKIRVLDDFIDIRKELNRIDSEEQQMKKHVAYLLNEKQLEDKIKGELKTVFEKYINETRKEYLVNEHLITAHLEGLFTAYHSVYILSEQLKNTALLSVTNEMIAIQTGVKTDIAEMQDN